MQKSKKIKVTCSECGRSFWMNSKRWAKFKNDYSICPFCHLVIWAKDYIPEPKMKKKNKVKFKCSKCGAKFWVKAKNHQAVNWCPCCTSLKLLEKVKK